MSCVYACSGERFEQVVLAVASLILWLLAAQLAELSDGSLKRFELIAVAVGGFGAGASLGNALVVSIRNYFRRPI